MKETTLTKRVYRHAQPEPTPQPAEAIEDIQPLDEPGKDKKFQSICITMDHLVRESHDADETVVKMVFSTFKAADALLNQINYFLSKGETIYNPLASMLNLQLLSNAADKAGSVFIYTPSERLTNVLLDEETFLEFVESEGDFYGATCAIVSLALGMELTYKQKGLPTEFIVAIPND